MTNSLVERNPYLGDYPPGISMKKLILTIILSAITLFFNLAQAHDVPSTQSTVLEEKNGQIIPLDLSFYDEKGNEIALKSLFDKPVILTLIYYTCDRICPQMLMGLAQVLPKIKLSALKDYRLITVSFDEQDTPQIARGLKKNFMKAVGSSFPDNGWLFLTGKKEPIKALTQSVGFSFQRDSHGFVHPIALIILSPRGKISRYIYIPKLGYGGEYPIIFSSVELETALYDARAGKIGTAVKRAFLYCFPHEPGQQKTFFRILSVAGIATLIGLIIFFILLKRPSPKKSARNKDGSA
jgi:protein SCO1